MNNLLNFELLTFLMAFVFALLVILIVLALFFKSSKLKIKDWFQLETEARGCKNNCVSYKEFEDSLVSNAIENDNKLEYLNGKQLKDIKDNYKDIQNIKDDTTELNIYKEYSLIVFITSIKVLYQLFKFIEDNHIIERTPTEITLLAKERAKELIALYDNAFKNSSYISIQTLTVEKLSGTFYYIIKGLMKDTYMEIYRNYSNKIKNREEDICNYIHANEQLDCMLKYEGIRPMMDSTFKSIQDTNYLILTSMTTDIINILLGLFYDKLKE